MWNKRLRDGYTYMVLMDRLNIAFCLMDCSANEECASVNYNQADKICELNRFADDTTIKRIATAQGWLFYKKENGVCYYNLTDSFNPHIP